MSAILYYLTLPFLYLVSILPRPLLYLLSDFIYVLVYTVFGYRKKVVTSNLLNAFPDKTTEEINKIRRDFYHYFCDLSLETIKTLSISPAATRQYFDEGDLSVLEHYFREKKSVIIVMGHLGNWELAGAYFSQMSLHQLYVIYHPLANKHFDRMFYRMRTRSGIKLYAMKETFRGMLRDRNKLTATAFIADQTPSPGSAYWMKFLNQDTPVFKGTEAIARKLGYPVVYLSVIREKRGRYRLAAELLAEHPDRFEENQLTELHTKRLERDIIDHPETWLWSHRRWKHKRPTSHGG
jgi:KDO2-lipid IV(A) lauroyltransferase